MCLHVRVWMWFLQLRGSWSSHGLPLVLLSTLWLNYCALIFFLFWYNHWVTCYGWTFIDFLFGKWKWVSYVNKGLSNSSCICSGGIGFGQWMNSSIIHDNICSVIHKKCHPKSCHSDIKHHMTLNIIFSVVGTYEPYPTRFDLQLGGFVLILTRI